MKTDRNDAHLSSELMQAFLDGETSPGEAVRVREHTSVCARCHAELDAWKTLFGELEEMTPLVPGPAFRERVMHAVPVPAPVRRSPFARAGRWVSASLRGVIGLPPAPPRHLHPAPERLQDFLEGILPQAEALGVEGHLLGCHECRADVRAWRGLLTGLERLPSFDPSPEFRERVMAHVCIQLSASLARPGLGERLAATLDAVSPRTRRRIAAFAGAGVTPAALVGLVAWAVFSRPLATLGNLASFFSFWVAERATSVAGDAFARLIESAAFSRFHEAFDLFGSSLGAAALAVTGLCALTLTAAWVLYRNVFTGPSGDRLYVR